MNLKNIWKYIVEQVEDFFLTIKYRYERVISYLRCRFILKHHIIDTKLEKGGWYDSDMRMLHGMMSLFMDYLQKEEPFETVNWDSEPEHRAARDEMIAIRDWWLSYSDKQKEIEATTHVWSSLNSVKGDSFLESLQRRDNPTAKKMIDRAHMLEAKLHEEEQDMLIRLIKIRDFLWT